MDVSSTHRSNQSQHNFKADLIAHYSAACAADSSLIRCLVTEQFVRKDVCIAAHILPHCRAVLLRVYKIPGLDSVNHVLNGFLWAERIEKAYTANQVCMIYNPFTSKLLFVVLDERLMTVPLGVQKGAVEMKFADLHCKELQLAPEKMPSLRLLLNQALFAMELANAQAWPRPANHANISRLLEAMRDIVARLVKDCSDGSDEVLRAWAQENPAIHDDFDFSEPPASD